VRRRDFIAGAVAASAIGRAQAQQSAKVYRIAVASSSVPVGELNENGSFRYRPFFRRLRELGYVEGQNLMVERHTPVGGGTENFSEIANAAVRSNPDLVFAEGDRMANAVKAATDTIPVVTIVADPIALGITTSLARPGGNITGVSVDPGTEFYGKHFELLRDIVPAASRVAWLASARLWEDSPSATTIRTMRKVAERLKVSLIGPPLAPPFDEAEYRRVLAAMIGGGADGLIVGAQGENLTNGRLIAEVVAEARLPAIYPYPEFASLGGLIAYGVDVGDILGHAAEQIDQILKGAKPGDIPLYQPTKFPLVINMKAAKALGIEISPNLLAQADEVIE
jgi:putative ABC transport system substrate-binding protein